MGTLLLDAGVPIERCLEELSVSEPERIQEIHEQYIAVGARVIETNTFGANAARLARFGLEGQVEEINRAAVHAAKKAAGSKGIYIAGSVGPTGLSAEQAAELKIDRQDCFREQIAVLVESGVHLIFFETFTDLEEMEIALAVKNELSGLPEICSFASAPTGELPSGQLLADAFTKLRGRGAKIWGVNCIDGPANALRLVQAMSVGLVQAAYPNAGYSLEKEKMVFHPATPVDFARAATRFVKAGVRLIGGCCGSTPKHIAAIAAAIAE